MYKVECEYWSGWADAEWHKGDKPWRFATVEEAQQEIDEFCAATGYDPSEYRVVKA